jgi:HEAT repeat protein
MGGWAIHALGLAADAHAVALARTLRDSGNVFVRYSAAIALVRLGQTKEGTEALLRVTDAADDESAFYRIRAAEDLVRLGEPTGLDVLIDLLETRPDHASGPREILEDLTGQYFLTVAEARAWRQNNPGAPAAVAPPR